MIVAERPYPSVAPRAEGGSWFILHRATRKEEAMKKIQRPTGVMLPMLVSLSLVGLIGTVAWGFLDYRGLVDRLDALPERPCRVRSP